MIRPFLLLILLMTLCGSAQASGDYWQQHVNYSIRVTLLDSIHTLDGSLSVVYTNNSPDTLKEVYFHLYANAFQPGSLMDERARQIYTNPIFDRISKLPEAEQGRYWIDNVQTDGKPADFEITGTIMRVSLTRILVPGDSITIAMPFRERIPRQIRRSGWMSREGVEYSMSQWYPKIAEYDREGWHRQEYVSHEFYGVWGEFTVQMTLPSRFAVGSSGECLNPAEVGHGYDKIASGVKEGSAPPEDKDGLTTWKFHAAPVHDFAWVADDDYVHEWLTWHDSVTLHSFYKSRLTGIWEHSALAYTKSSLSTYGIAFSGQYGYKNFTTSMAGDGGMEYPQLIMITGYRPGKLSLAGVIAHEVAHQWFYGMLGSNETREAFMDEGFTSYATTLAMDHLFGDHQDRGPGLEHTWLDWFLPLFSNKMDNYRGYQDIASKQYEEPLDIPHDWFREDATGGQVYGKTQAILSTLEYTLGEDVFSRGMKKYFNDWKFKHPHLVDFKRAMESVANTDLDWFFDEWFRTTRTVDYEAMNVTSDPNPRGFATTVRLRNKDLAVMPIDLLLHYDDGSTSPATIPIVTNKDKTYLKPDVPFYFPGWDWVSPEYHGMAITPKRVSWFEIDTSWRLQDLNWINNYSDRSGLWMPEGDWVVWKQLFQRPPINEYYSVLRPIVWYDEPSKFNVGIGSKFGMNNSFSGDFKLIYKSDPTRIDGPVTWTDYLDGRLVYSTPVDWIGRLGAAGFDVSKMDGIRDATVSLSKVFRPEYFYLGADHSAKLFVESQQLLNSVYPYYHTEWSPGSVTDIGFRYSIVSNRDAVTFDLAGETGLVNSSQQYSLIKAKYETDLSSLWSSGARLRITGGAASNATPFERRFWLDRANNYDEQKQSGLFPAVTAIDRSVGNDASMFVEGGAGVRGYNSSHNNPALDPLFSGTGMLGANLDLDLPNLLSWLGSVGNSFAFGLFTDAGWVGSGVANAWDDIRTNIRTDAGVKISLNILSWLPYQLRGVAEEYGKIPEINFNIPLYENHPLDGTKPFAWRWAVSIGSAF